MEPFDYRGKKLEVWTQSGTVLSTSKHSKTDVASYGGGGWVGQHGGSVAAPTIVSSTATEQEIWIRRDNGEETAITLVNVEVPVRQGQRVTFIAAKSPQAKSGFWVTLVNHSANRYWRLSTNVEASKKGKLGAYPLVRWYDLLVTFLIGKLMFPVVLPFLAFFTPPNVAHGNEGVPWAGLSILFGTPILYPVVRCLLRIRRKSRMFAALDIWAERNAEEAFKVGGVSTVPVARTEKVA